MPYLSFDQKTIDKNDAKVVSESYKEGFLFTRIDPGVMQKTRSVRIDLSKFKETSENRRILKKTNNISLGVKDLPYESYTWEIGKIAKDFYEKKFGEKTFSAQKVKELMTNTESNFNKILIYSDVNTGENVAYTIVYQNDEILHYSYPFYNISKYESAEIPKDIGLGMMTRAIEYSKAGMLKYIYLGSLQRPSDIYKLQFEGLEWFNEELGTWSTDINKAKEKIKTN